MSRAKIARVRPMDQPPPQTGAGGTPLVSELAAPEQPRTIITAPTGLTVDSTGFDRNDSAISGYARLSWRPGQGTPSDAGWEFEWSQATDFSLAPLKKITTNPGEIRGLKIGATYVRVRAVVAGLGGSWSAPATVTIAGISDAPPPPPVQLTATWSPSGEVEIRATPPTAEQVDTIRIRILTASGGTTLRTIDADSGAVTWTVAMQRNDRGIPSGALPGTAFIVANTVSWAGNLSSDVTTSVSLAAPGTPTGLTTTWASDTGSAAADVTVIWTPVLGMRYELAIDTLAREALGGRYPYSEAQNAQEHGGSPDPNLAISLVAIDALERRSTAATTTAVNAAPAAATITTLGNFSKLSVFIAPPSPRPADLLYHRVRVYRNSSIVRTIEDPSDLVVVDTTGLGSGSYQVDVIEVDRFGQTSAPSALSVAATLTDDAAFATALRSGARYRDTRNTNVETLKAQLADGNRTSGGVTYS
jgi:hypothetical protein